MASHTYFLVKGKASGREMSSLTTLYRSVIMVNAHQRNIQSYQIHSQSQCLPCGKGNNAKETRKTACLQCMTPILTDGIMTMMIMIIMMMIMRLKPIQENWEHIALRMEGGWVGELEGWQQISSSTNSTLPSGPKMLKGIFPHLEGRVDKLILFHMGHDDNDDL